MTPLNTDRWQGHLPVTSQALSALLERAARGGVQFTAAERALFTACEFWVAVNTRTLAAHLGPHAADALRHLSIVYSAMGAHDVAQLLIAGVGEIAHAASPPGRLQRLTALQQRVAATSDSVDQLIAGLAHNLGLSAIASPYRLAGPAADLGAATGQSEWRDAAGRSDHKFASAQTNGASR